MIKDNEKHEERKRSVYAYKHTYIYIYASGDKRQTSLKETEEKTEKMK